jgi:hypothetical protein
MSIVIQKSDLDQEHVMGEVIRFVSKAELERTRLIREARANYDRIFPPADTTGEQSDSKK